MFPYRRIIVASTTKKEKKGSYARFRVVHHSGTTPNSGSRNLATERIQSGFWEMRSGYSRDQATPATLKHGAARSAGSCGRAQYRDMQQDTCARQRTFSIARILEIMDWRCYDLPGKIELTLFNIKNTVLLGSI